ncbi:uncharacterized protein ARMOST_07145 [Armillaria ostoyae]|uniref:Transcription factor BYE1 n=1 Tax=Armillaria ostoyae TaxID=47428 RepID=A0A284R508_ARMOS|nr:uncharacterized protein ARMOST_07145 [Armillaria ostoyae]
MSTRTTRARVALGSTPPSSSAPVKQPAKPKGRTDSAHKVTAHPEKENEKSGTKLKSIRTKTTKSKKVYCICRKGDDGTPMIQCAECTDWYHFSCVNLTENTAEDIVTWEGPNALEEVVSLLPAKAATRRKALQSDAEESSESENVPSSEDEYVAENVQPRVGAKRPTRRLSYSSESESDSSKKPARNRRSSHHSPGPSNTLKRKAQAVPHPPPASKKTKTSPESTEDPTRKYCLGKLEDLFRGIFLKYPLVRTKDDGEGSDGAEKKAEELTEEEKEAVLSAARQFANDLEHCVYEIYCDPDKHAGDGYKDRFRTLQFNLSKVDRVVLHKRIVSGKISAKEISTMSSTDLADEETKQSIKIAEQESLEHSILQKTTAPRAKITHKGLQDIEDVNGEVTSRRERDREREAEEQERMERERMARLRAAQPRQRTMSVSVPPESPVSQNASWGLPPPVPLHDVHASADSYASARPPVYENTTEPVEPELSLTDLINIDDDPMVEAAPTDGASAASPVVSAPELATLNVASPTIGISPFASRPSLPETPLSASFDLNSIWSSQNTGEAKTSQEPSPPQETKDQPIDPEPIAEADDRDFDMFLEEKEPERPLSPGGVQAAFNATEPVWSGKITMPLDSSIPTETPIVARQMGGRPIEVGSPLWRTLFPADLLRIDGRVPVDKSAQFLLQVRLNPSKELIGVAFMPAPDATDNGFMVFADFLIGKGRHGLVFPWGPRPKDAPGRELYIVPLLSSDPIPEFMELLDNLRLPKVRQTTYMIGIWVLNKGELKPPPEPATAPPPTISSPVPAVPMISPIPNIPALANLAPPPIAPAQIEPAALAAEVAALTPEQIQLMIRTLQGPGGLSIPIPPVPTPAPAPSIPVAPLVPAPLPQSWGINPLQPPQPPHHNGGPPMYGVYPPLPPPPPTNSDQRRDYSRPGYDRGGSGEFRERRDSRGGPDRGGDRPRGRGRGRGRGGGNDMNRPVDSGWPRRRPDGGSTNGNPSPQW